MNISDFIELYDLRRDNIDKHKTRLLQSIADNEIEFVTHGFAWIPWKTIHGWTWLRHMWMIRQKDGRIRYEKAKSS